MRSPRDKRSVNFGIGLGVVFAVAVVFVVYIIQRQYYFAQGLRTETVFEQMTDAQVVDRAKELGMFFAEELLTYQIYGCDDCDDPASAVSDDPASGGPTSDTPYEDGPYEPHDPNDPIAVAQAAEAAAKASEAALRVRMAELEAQLQALQNPANPRNPAPSPARAEVEGYVWVQIRQDTPSITIARQLYQAGVIEDQDDFLNFIRENRLERSLMAGTFLLPLNGDFDDIMRHILAGYRSFRPRVEDE
jgi:hypothetical protein